MAVVLALVAAAQPSAAQDGAPRVLAGRLVSDTVRSAALENNLLGDPSAQPVAVYLPPGYDAEPARRYPVLYLLPPFGGGPSTWTRAWPRLFGPVAGVSVIDSAMRAGHVPPMIVVMPNGRNRYGGSFFIDSPVSGGWERFIARDVVAHVERRYRAIPGPGSRGIAGHSMGGYAALRLAMRQPDVFGAAYGLSPCCLGFDRQALADTATWARVAALDGTDAVGAALAGDGFMTAVYVALAAGISPDPQRPPLFIAPPFERVTGGMRASASVHARWADAFPVAQVERYAQHLRSLRGLRFDHGTAELDVLESGARAFSRALAERDIAHGYEVYVGTHHDRVMERLGTRVLPFFAEALEHRPASVERIHADSSAAWFEDEGVSGMPIAGTGLLVLASWNTRRVLDLETGLDVDLAGRFPGLDRIFGIAPAGARGVALYGIRGEERGWFTTDADGPVYTGLPPNAGPAWSPDGGRVAYRLGAGDTLHLRADGAARSYPLPGAIAALAWAPDGAAVYALVRDTLGRGALYRVEPERGVVAPLRDRLYVPVDYNSLAVAPDGARLFLALAGPVAPAPEARHDPATDRDLDIYAFDLATRELRPIVATPAAEFAPSVADGQLYWTRNAYEDAVVLVPAAGGESRVAVEDAILPEWSPDGRRLAFTRGLGGANGALASDAAVVPLDEDARVAGPASYIVSGLHEDFTPAWSPDGRWIAYHSHRSSGPVSRYDGPATTDDIYLRRADAPMRDEIRLTDFGWEVGWADWSPDGRRLVFDSWERGGRAGVSRPWIATIRPEDGRLLGVERVPLPEGVDNATTPAWSPSGEEIALDVRRGGRAHELWVVRSDGSGAVELVDFESTTYGGVDWLPDGSALVYGALADGRMHLFALPRDGGAPRRLTHGEANHLHPRVSPDGRWIAATRLVRVKEVWRMILR